ncbi:hypothetical protein QJR26_08185 [Clostridium baratii]
MNKKLFLKLGLLLLSMSLVGCGQENNLTGKDNSSKSSASQSVSDTQSSGEESIKTTYLSAENAVKSEQDDEDAQPKSSVSQSVSDTQSSGEENIKTTSTSAENAVKSEPDDKEVKPSTQQEANKEEYYDLIKKAWQKQEDYINSIDDPKEKQSVQTAHSAAIFKANELLLAHPEDSEAINESLKKVLDGE